MYQPSVPRVVSENNYELRIYIPVKVLVSTLNRYKQGLNLLGQFLSPPLNTKYYICGVNLYYVFRAKN
jgi:hypothetical protein